MGVACNDDAQKLHADHGLCVRGCVDLRYIAVRSKSFNVGVTGLKGMAEKVLNVTLNKSYHLRCSDWEAEELSDAQVCPLLSYNHTERQRQRPMLVYGDAWEWRGGKI